MCNISKDMETIKKESNKMLEIKYIATQMKKTFYWLISRFDKAEEKICELQYR